MKMDDKMQPTGQKPRWAAIDDARFLLMLSGMISDSENRSIKKKLLAKCKKDGIHLK